MSRPPSRARARRDSEYSAAVPGLDSTRVEGESHPSGPNGRSPPPPSPWPSPSRTTAPTVAPLAGAIDPLPPGAARGDVRFLTRLASLANSLNAGYCRAPASWAAQITHRRERYRAAVAYQIRHSVRARATDP